MSCRYLELDGVALMPAVGQHPPALLNQVGAGFVRGPAVHPRGGPLPVHAQLLWGDGVVDVRYAVVTEWVGQQVHLQLHARGSLWLPWLVAGDVTRCTC